MTRFEITYALIITVLVLAFSIYTFGLFKDVNQSNADLPRAIVLPTRLVNYTADPSCCEDAYNLQSFILGISGVVVEYKKFKQIDISIGGVIAYENSTVETDANGFGNTSFILRDIFPEAYPFPYQEYLASPFVLSKVLRPDIEATTYVQYNIQPNGLDIKIHVFITQNAPQQNVDNLWLMVPVSYNYIISK